MARTSAQLVNQYVGKRLAWSVGKGVEIAVRCADVRVTYGRELVLIAPVAGLGSRWVDAKSVRVVENGWVGGQ